MSSSSDLEYADWSSAGLLENRVGSGTGYEIPTQFVGWACSQGESYGAARVDAGLALTDGCGVFRYIDGGIGVRRHLQAEATTKTSIPARKLASSEKARKAKAQAQADGIRDRIPLLVGKEDAATVSATEAKADFDAAVQERAGLSFTDRGLIKSKGTLLFIEGGAVAFDCALLHGALEYSGAGDSSVWLTSLLAPAAIAGVHITFGTLAGWIARRMPPGHRVRAATAALAAGFGVLLAAFVLVGVFREAGTDALNAGLAGIASGDESASPELFLSSLWMLPLQIATSISAILAVAVWVLGQPGRDADHKVRQARQAKAKADSELAMASGRVEAARDQVREAELSVHQMSVATREAEAEIVANKEALGLRLGAEDHLGEAAKGRYKAAYVLTDQIYDNGHVRRAAIGDEERRRGKLWRRPSRDVSEQVLAGQVDPNDSDDTTTSGGGRRWFSTKGRQA